MADRIVKTQEIQSAHLNATTQFVQVAMGATQMQMNSCMSHSLNSSLMDVVGELCGASLTATKTSL